MLKYFLIPLIFVLLYSCKNRNSAVSVDVGLQTDSTFIKISLAQWSFHKALKEGKMTHFEFITKAGEMGFNGVEYVNVFFKEKAQDTSFLSQMTINAQKAGVKQLLIMIDGEGYLGDINKSKRDSAIQNHYKWIDAASFLGCHSIRVNAHGEGGADEVALAAVDGLSRLSEYASTKGINVLVENHGGYSSNGVWLVDVISRVNKSNCGTLPDFGNFCLKRADGDMWNKPCLEEYDRYKGVSELMPFAKAVSAKSFDFGELGFETTIDYQQMIEIVKNSGYTGFIGVEYEGENLSEYEGIKATKSLIEKCLNPVAK